MKNLIEIINDYNLFKGEHMYGTDKEFLHSYVSNFYQSAFEPLQQNPIELLEIGTFTGASLKMWKEFFVNGKVSGVDIEDKRIAEYIDEQITYYHADAYQKAFVDTLPEFDIIIDDGPHTLGSQLIATNLYYSKLKEGGLFVIEDIDSDMNIRLLSECVETVFKKTPNIIDNRVIAKLNNECILWVQK